MPIPTFVVRVHRAGNSLCIRIPKNMRQQMGFGLGDLLVIRMKPPYAVISPFPSDRIDTPLDIIEEAFPDGDALKPTLDRRSR